jgi:hypothetical protein
MTRPKKTTTPAPAVAAVPAPVLAPTKTSHLFTSKKGDSRSAITHERLAADLAAFRKAGGKIEVLGVTPALRRIDPIANSGQATAATAAAVVPAAPAKRRR